jgi:hypothetical protein
VPLFDVLQVKEMLRNEISDKASSLPKLEKNDMKALIREVSDKLCT